MLLNQNTLIYEALTQRKHPWVFFGRSTRLQNCLRTSQNQHAIRNKMCCCAQTQNFAVKNLPLRLNILSCHRRNQGFNTQHG